MLYLLLSQLTKINHNNSTKVFPISILFHSVRSYNFYHLSLHVQFLTFNSIFIDIIHFLLVILVITKALFLKEKSCLSYFLVFLKNLSVNFSIIDSLSSLQTVNYKIILSLLIVKQYRGYLSVFCIFKRAAYKLKNEIYKSVAFFELNLKLK